MKFRLVESCFLDREEGGSVLKFEPDLVALVVDHPGRMFGFANLQEKSQDSFTIRRSNLLCCATVSIPISCCLVEAINFSFCFQTANAAEAVVSLSE